jgi:alpha-amylase
MTRAALVLGIHDHQPVGNFGHVFDEAYERAYRPFLEALERHPGVKVSLHTSGPLVEWLEEHRPDYFDRVRALVEAGRVEIVGGAFYEPILASIDEEDAVAQVERMAAWAVERFGARPAGAWVAERVWSVNLPRPLARAGVRYVCLDTHHFESAGTPEDDLDGHRVTEFEGHTVAVFPISKRLRYTIPFEEPAASIEILRRAAARATERNDGREAVLVMADDGEKFGVWPGTFDHCYANGWIERFFDALERETAWLRCSTFSEVLAEVPPTGRIYLPETSYKEMAEWAPGGLWRNFLVKYPEANRMQKKAARVSRKVRAMRPGARRDQAERRLQMGQCNCAYWHGVFGGLYLNFLRGAVWENLVAAEAAADADHRRRGGPWVRAEEADIDADLRNEIVVESDALVASIAPHRGGAIEEVSARAVGANLLDTLARRPEAYHEKIRRAVREAAHAAAGGGRAGGTQTIHEIVRLKEPDLDKYLRYDAAERLAAQEVLGDEDLRSVPWTLEEIVQGKRDGGPVEVRLAREVLGPSGPSGPAGGGLRLAKTFRFEKGRAGFDVAYRIENRAAAVETTLETQWSLGLQAPEADDRWIEVDGKRPLDSRPCGRGEEENVRTVTAHDGWRRFRVVLAWDRPAHLRREPIETVSASEAGFERAYQGTTFAPRWRVRLAPGEAWEVAVALAVETIR